MHAPLRFIPEHHAVFRGRTAVGNLSSVPGSEPEQPQVPTNAAIDVEELVDLPATPPSPDQQPMPPRRRGKRVATPGSNSRGSKKTRSDSTGEALQRLADLRVKSCESKAQKQREREAMGARACIELLKGDGHLFSSDVYHMGIYLFSDPYFCEFFLADAITPEMREYYIRAYYAMKCPGRGFFPPPSCSGGWLPGGGGFDGGQGGDPGDDGAGGADGAAVC